MCWRRRVADRLKIGLAFQVNTYTGWGVVGLNIALELAAMPDVDLSLWSADLTGVSPLELSRLLPIAQRCQRELQEAQRTRTPIAFDGVLVSADGNQCTGPRPDSVIQATKHMGLMVFEDTALTPEKLERLKRYDWLVTASRWNHDVLASHGVSSHLVPQGIDPTIWHPAPKSGRWNDRFVVFSGGKLEYRKGQDIVLAAFKMFHVKHLEALLVTSWQNQWPALAIDMTLNGHVEHEPVVTSDGVDIEGWCVDNGIPEGAHIELGMVPNALLAPIVREADVAVFASRAEGGTNLGAMECLAAGVPTLFSDNTGHRDLPGWRINQRGQPRQPTRFFDGVEGWGESDPLHLVERLEWWLEDSRKKHAGKWLGSLRESSHHWQHHTNQLVTLIRTNDASAAA